MNIVPVVHESIKLWNEFVRLHYPPVGAFIQTWEWGVFQEKMGRKITRYFIKKGENVVAAFTLIHHSLPFGFKYGYAARGPVIAQTELPNSPEMIEQIREWSKKEFPELIFVRL